MGNTVFGTFTAKREENPRETALNMFNHIMDSWYNDEINTKPGVDAYEELVRILKHGDVALYALANKLSPVQPVLNIGLPPTHYAIPEPADQSKTGSLASSSDQSGLTCASHATGKAILELLHRAGWDAKQQDIIDALVEKVQPSGQAENPDKFNKVTIKVKVTNQQNSNKNGVIELEIRVQNRWGEVMECDSGSFNTFPVAAAAVNANMIGMVLRWIMWDSSKQKYMPHAIYAREYSTATKKYAGINSWGDTQGYPKIHESEVASIYYVTIIQVLP